MKTIKVGDIICFPEKATRLEDIVHYRPVSDIIEIPYRTRKDYESLPETMEQFGLTYKKSDEIRALSIHSICKKDRKRCDFSCKCYSDRCPIRTQFKANFALYVLEDKDHYLIGRLVTFDKVVDKYIVK